MATRHMALEGSTSSGIIFSILSALDARVLLHCYDNWRFTGLLTSFPFVVSLSNHTSRKTTDVRLLLAPFDKLRANCTGAAPFSFAPVPTDKVQLTMPTGGVSLLTIQPPYVSLRGYASAQRDS